jgi:hypothetical protein
VHKDSFGINIGFLSLIELKSGKLKCKEIKNLEIIGSFSPLLCNKEPTYKKDIR